MHARGAILLSAIGLLLASCGVRFGGSSSADEALNTLRSENTTLRDQLAKEQSRVKELQAALAGANTNAPIDVLPLPAEVQIDRLSGLWAAKGNDQERVVAILRPIDGRGRFTQVAANLSARADVIDASGNTVREVARWELSPQETRNAYRAGAFGAHYMLTHPWPTDFSPAAGSKLRLFATFTDVFSGTPRTCERTFEIARSPAP